VLTRLAQAPIVAPMRTIGRDDVYRYWEAETCGTAHATSPYGTPSYYAEIEAARYRLEPFIPGFAEFGRWQDRRVLEIGIGAGTDYVNFARAGASVTGVDLTPAAVEHAHRRLELENLEGEAIVASGDALPFENGSFDLVYSWGVMHHAPHPVGIVREASRLVAPDGELRVMLYGRHSWVAYALWLRYAMLAGRPWLSLTDVVAAHMESPGTQAYTRRELELLFQGVGFDHVEVIGFRTPYDRRVAGPLARIIRLDWFLGVIATR
jgi:SAM-dependent methyltransferase